MDLDKFRKLVRETFTVLRTLEDSNVVVDILPEFHINVSIEGLDSSIQFDDVAKAIIEDEYIYEDLLISIKYSKYYDNVKRILKVVDTKNMDCLRILYEELLGIMPECFEYNKNTDKGYVTLNYASKDDDLKLCSKSLAMGYVITTIDNIFEVCKDWRMYNTSRIVNDFPQEIDDTKYREYAINI